MDFKGMLMTIQSAIYVLLLVLFQEKKNAVFLISVVLDFIWIAFIRNWSLRVQTQLPNNRNFQVIAETG